MKLLVMNGPNLNMLGIREPDIYGKQDYQALMELVKETCDNLGVELETYQSNHEGDLVDRIQMAYGDVDGIVINPGAYTHTSVALLDAIKGTGIPTVEVHISDVKSREPFRQVSYIGQAAEKRIMGMGLQGYVEGIHYLYGKYARVRNKEEKAEQRRRAEKSLLINGKRISELKAQ